MWWWRKVRKANIPSELRSKFELYGEDMIASVLATRTEGNYGDLSSNLGEALAWLTERRDIHERREDRLETVEWAILCWVMVGVIADIVLVMK
jgi:hypothetical protein